MTVAGSALVPKLCWERGVGKLCLPGRVVEGHQSIRRAATEPDGKQSFPIVRSQAELGNECRRVL